MLDGDLSAICFEDVVLNDPAPSLVDDGASRRLGTPVESIIDAITIEISHFARLSRCRGWRCSVVDGLLKVVERFRVVDFRQPSNGPAWCQVRDVGEQSLAAGVISEPDEVEADGSTACAHEPLSGFIGVLRANELAISRWDAVGDDDECGSLRLTRERRRVLVEQGGKRCLATRPAEFLSPVPEFVPVKGFEMELILFSPAQYTHR